jgi:hypothetical protein
MMKEKGALSGCSIVNPLRDKKTITQKIINIFKNITNKIGNKNKGKLDFEQDNRASKMPKGKIDYRTLSMPASPILETQYTAPIAVRGGNNKKRTHKKRHTKAKKRAKNHHSKTHHKRSKHGKGKGKKHTKKHHRRR